MNLYPVMLKLENKRAVIAGGGRVALRKAADLLNSGACVKVISPAFEPGFEELVREYGAKIELVKDEYRKGGLDGADIVFSAADDPAVNSLVSEEALLAGLPINVADDPGKSTFFVPSYTVKGSLLVAVSTGGASPAMAARLRREIENTLPENIGEILEALDGARELLKNDPFFGALDFVKRGLLLRKIVNDDSLLQQAVFSKRAGDLKDFLVQVSVSGREEENR